MAGKKVQLKQNGANIYPNTDIDCVYGADNTPISDKIVLAESLGTYAGAAAPLDADTLDGSTKQEILNNSTPQDISSTFATLSSGYSFMDDVNKQIIKLSSMIFYGAQLSPSGGSLGSGWITLMTISSNYLPKVSLPITFILYGSAHTPLKYCDGEITTGGAVRIYNNQAISSGLVRIYTQFFYVL